jgi:hypothetical protein
MDSIIKDFLKSKDVHPDVFEFETQIRGENTKTEYNNVIKWLLMAGFKIKDVKGEDLMRIVISGENHTIRVELLGIDQIQYYCQTQIVSIASYSKKEKIKRVVIPEYWSTLTLSKETEIAEAVDLLKHKKMYRYMNRVRLYKEGVPFVYDCSIVRMSDSLDALFTTTPSYEIEAEFERSVTLKENIQKAITFVLRGFQQSHFPISLTEMDEVRSSYKDIIKTKEFIGPKSITLQKEHLDTILTDYCVTDKADGERKMLFIIKKRIYFIISHFKQLGIQYTGCKSDLDGTLLDGEHVTLDIDNNRVNMYVAFDAYFDVKKDVRSNALFIEGNKETRYEIVKSIILALRDGPLSFSYKDFQPCTQENCSAILTKKMVYHTDGLIFTPTLLGVGISKHNTKIQDREITWDLSFKWKPVKDNTIDFLVKFTDKTHYINEVKVKQVELYVGFSKGDLYADSSYSILNGYEIALPKNKILFKPTNPFDTHSHVMFVHADDDGIIRTEATEIIETDMIVECRYDKKWIPLRVRWDKMKHLNPNGFNTAASNWYTIQHPIDSSMLGKESTIVRYYEPKSGPRSGLQKFHNDVKRNLLEIIKKDQTVIDFAVGKGGDLDKWKLAKFVLGVDIDENNIMNKDDGACKRYLENWSTRQNLRGIFVQGNSAIRLKTGDAITREIDKIVVRYLFGEDKKHQIEPGVVHRYGVAKDGFDVSSIQFAMHYMFVDETSLTRFIKNVTECTKLNGHFVGTCYDGELVFDKLKDRDTYTIESEGEPLCAITKKYIHSSISVKSCLGYQIDVLQAMIGNTHTEWLVYFPYFEKVMESYGFELIKRVNFKDLYGNLKVTHEMTAGEKELSFLNTAFTFKKVRNIMLIPSKENFIRIKGSSPN